MANNNAKVYDSFFEDDNADYIFYYTGKSNIIGLPHFDHIYKNEKRFKYARVAFYTFYDAADPDLITHIEEDLTIAILSDLYDEDNIQYNTTLHVKVRASAKNMRVIKSSVILNEDRYGDGLFGVVAVEDAYQDEDGKVKYGLGIWVESDLSKMKYICTLVNESLSTNSAPINGESFYPASYNAEYLNDYTVVANENVANSLSGAFGTAINRFDRIYNSLKDIEDSASFNQPLYKSNSVVYDATFTPTGAEDIVKPTSVRKQKAYDEVVHIDSVNKTATVNERGTYSIQLKNGFYLVKGSSRVDLKVYIGNQEINELGLSMYLTSNGEEDARKAIKNTFCSPVYYIQLNKGDQIKLTATWTNKDGITLENETMLIVTKLTNHVEFTPV